MSILTIRSTTNQTTNTAENVLADFNETLDTFTLATTADDKANLCIELVALYAEYSYIYLQTISYTLQADNDKKDTLTFMNSVIAEVAHKAHIAYFHRELGYTIIDKAVAYFMAHGGGEDLKLHIAEVVEEMNRELAEEAEANAIIKAEEDKLRAKQDLATDPA